MSVRTEERGPVLVITLDRPEVRNAVDRATAAALRQACLDFDAEERLRVAVLTGAGGVFCSGADLKALGDPERGLVAELDGPPPMGFSDLRLSKPVIAAVEGFAVAGGLELAIWCDLRVAAEDAVFGVFNRRWGVPLVDGGTVRLPRLLGHGRALDLILTGRGVSGSEALAIGLIDRLVLKGAALAVALELAKELAAFPQAGLRSDRLSTIEQWEASDPFQNERRRGLESLAGGEWTEGVGRFKRGR
jgi:enoyl-CoA hydratase